MNMKDLELRCDCGRFLRIRPTSTTIATVLCSNSKCKKESNIKIVNSKSSKEDIEYSFENGETAKVTELEEQLTKQINNLKAKLEDNESYIAQLEGIVDGQG